MAWDSIETYEKRIYKKKDTFDRKLLEEWLEGKDIVTWRSSGAVDVPRFLATGRENTGYKNIEKNVPPYMDHVSYFKSTKPLKVWMVYHPYHDLNDISDEIRE